MRSIRASLALMAACAVAACSGGGVSVGSGGPQPAGTATAAVAPTGGATTSPPIASPAATTTATPPAPSSSPTASSSTPSATPLASPTAAPSAALTCTNPNMGIQNETWTLNGSAFTIPLPPYGTFTGTISFPAQNPASTVVSESTEQTNFNYAPTSSSADPGYGNRTDDLFATFRLSQDTTFNAGAMTLLPITIVSTCLTSGTTYYLDQFSGSTFVYANSAAASAGMVTLDVLISPNPFPAGTYINVVLNH